MTKHSPIYSVERWELGWTVSCPVGLKGVPLGTLSEIQSLFPKDAIVDGGIPNFINKTTNLHVVLAVASPSDAEQWRKDIEEFLLVAMPDAQRRWWCGTNVGLSSAAIFSALCDDPWLSAQAEQYSNGSVPQDADDFKRCSHLLSLFPEWRNQLDEVAQKWSEGKWSKLIEKWDAIASSENATEMIQEILRT